MLAQDIMTTSVVTISPDTDIEAIAQLLLDKRISAVPVVDSAGTVLGIVSDTDLMHRISGWPSPHESIWLMWFQSPSELAQRVKKAIGRSAADIMTSPAVTVPPSAPIADVAELLAARHIRRVPVVRDHKLVGIVSRTNLIQALAVSGAAAERDSSFDDGKIRDSVLSLVRDRRPHDRHLVNAIVSDGVVHLWGVVDTPKDREAHELLAESVTGVKAVHNHITCPEFVSDIASVV